MVTMPDQILLERWAVHRDAVAFREIVLRHAGMVYGTCRRILGSPADAEDVTQECFVRLAQGRDRITASLPGWLHVLATHRSLDRLRSEKRRLAREQQFASSVEPEPEPVSPRLMAQVDEAIAELPEALRAPIILHFLEGQTQEAAAQRLGLSRSAVSRRIDKGIEQVRKTLRRRGLTLGATALATTLGGLAEAAPASVTAALGRLALAGGTGVAATATVAGGAGVALAVKTICAAGGLALAVTAFAVLAPSTPLSPPPPTVSAPAPSVAAPVEASSSRSMEADSSEPILAVKRTSTSQAPTSPTPRTRFESSEPAPTVASVAAYGKFHAAELLYSAKRYGMAKSICEQLTQDYPNWDAVGIAWMMIGNCWSQMGNNDKEVAALEEAVKCYPDQLGPNANEYVYLRLAYAYGNAGQTNKQMQTLEKCVEVCEEGRGLDSEVGRQALRQLHLFNANNLFMAKRYDEALPLYERLAAEYPDIGGFASLRMAYCYERTGQTDEALKAFERVATKYPEAPPHQLALAWFDQGRLYRNAGETEKAIDAFQKAVDFSEKEPEASGFVGPEAQTAIAALRNGTSPAP